MVSQISEVANKSFDYVIVGGGTAGLALASRLASDNSVTIVVLEAGSVGFEDPKIYVPGNTLGLAGRTDGIDWNFKTKPQKTCNDRSFTWNRGKVLGGSSAINYHCWITPPAHDINVFENLGNPGWNWGNFSEYVKRAETSHPANEEQLEKYPYQYAAESHGTTGPIQTSILHHSVTIDNLYQETLAGMDMRKIGDPYSGDINGIWIAHGAVDPNSRRRSYSVNYINRSQGASNLVVLTEATVARVVSESEGSDPDGLLVITGVEFIYRDNTYLVKCNKEVILSAGAIKDPQILELSGIGKPEVLRKIEVELKIDLPGVGENVQEHNMYFSTFGLNSGEWGPTADDRKDPVKSAAALKLYAEGKGVPWVLLSTVCYFSLQFANPEGAEKLITEVEEKISNLKKSGTLPAGLAEQYDIQLAALRDPNIPDIEIIPNSGLAFGDYDPARNYTSMGFILNHPFSRGSIHAISQDPLQDPEIDPHYFEVDFDLEIFVQGIHFSRKMLEHEPMKSKVAGELYPGPLAAPNPALCDSDEIKRDVDEKIRDCVKNRVTTVWHTIGSCSMLPREKNGVVAPDLKVYGTKNLRVVDISIIPLHIAAHTQTAAYAIAEKAADIIRASA